jgi:hypothetical protein
MLSARVDPNNRLEAASATALGRARTHVTRLA